MRGDAYERNDKNRHVGEIRDLHVEYKTYAGMIIVIRVTTEPISIEHTTGDRLVGPPDINLSLVLVAPGHRGVCEAGLIATDKFQ